MQKNSSGLTPLGEAVANVVSQTARPTGAHLYEVGDVIGLPGNRSFKVEKIDAGAGLIKGHTYYRPRQYTIEAFDRYWNKTGYHAGQILSKLDGSALEVLRILDVDAYRVQLSGQPDQPVWRHEEIVAWIGGSSVEVSTRLHVDPITGEITAVEPAAVNGSAPEYDADKAERDHLLSAAYGSDEDTVPPAMPDAEIAAKLETGEMQGVMTKPAPIDDLDTNPFEKILNSEVIALQDQVRTLQAELTLERDRARHFEEMLNEALAAEPVAETNSARVEVYTVWQKLEYVETEGARTKLDAFLTNQRNLGYVAVHEQILADAGGQPTFRVVRFERPEPAKVSRVFDPFAAAVTVHGNLTVDELVGNKAVA